MCVFPVFQLVGNISLICKSCHLRKKYVPCIFCYPLLIIHSLLSFPVIPFNHYQFHSVSSYSISLSAFLDIRMEILLRQKFSFFSVSCHNCYGVASPGKNIDTFSSCFYQEFIYRSFPFPISL